MDVELPAEKHFEVAHYTQRYNWDCGVSCILMILSSAQKREFLDDFDSICREEGFGNSTWTIDLCYLLKRYDIRHDYYTKTLGIDPDYEKCNYYKRVIDQDKERVTRKFREAESNGLHVEQRTVDMPAILSHLAHHGPIILLTNAWLLTCDICKPKNGRQNGCLTLICIVQSASAPLSYAGHYVLLCGYNLKTDKIYYHNPERFGNHVCRCSISAMDAARTAYGTDEDIILIYA